MRSVLLVFLLAVPTVAPADPVAEVRALYAEIEGAALEGKSITFSDGESDVDGKVTGLRNGESSPVRKSVTEVTTGDHGGWTQRVYSDAGGRVRFVFFEQSTWQFDPDTPGEGKTIDRFTQRRFYWDGDGKLVRALEKSFAVRDGEERGPLEDAATNETLTVGALSAARVRDVGAALGEAESPGEGLVVAKRVTDAYALMGADDPPSSPGDWEEISWLDGFTIESPVSLDEAGRAVLRVVGELAQGEEAPRTVWVDELGDDVVLVTIDGMLDDSVRGARYRIDFAREGTSLWPTVILRQFRCWQDRGHAGWSKEPCS